MSSCNSSCPSPPSFCDSFSLPSVVFLLVVLTHAPLFRGALWARFPPLFHPPPVFPDLLLLVHVVLLRSGRTACLVSAFVFLLVSKMAAAAKPLLLSPDLHPAALHSNLCNISWLCMSTRHLPHAPHCFFSLFLPSLCLIHGLSDISSGGSSGGPQRDR